MAKWIAETVPIIAVVSDRSGFSLELSYEGIRVRGGSGCRGSVLR
jgi:hypothetical protein